MTAGTPPLLRADAAAVWWGRPVPYPAPVLTPAFDRDADAYRRRIRLSVPEPGIVVSQLEDDFHFFEITLRHDAERVLAVDAASHRWPWSTCPSAAEPLR